MSRSRSSVGKVQAASDRDWKAAAWLLERRFRARWARQVETPAEGPSENQTSLHAHQHLHINFDTIETPVLEFIHRHRLEFGTDPTKDLFFNEFSREPSPEEAKLLSEAKRRALEAVATRPVSIPEPGQVSTLATMVQ